MANPIEEDARKSPQELRQNPGYSDKKPEAVPGQITDLNELVEGVRLLGIHRGEVYAAFKVLGEPEVDENGKTWLPVLTNTKKGPKERRISLADHGVISYPNGYWNTWNMLRRVDQIGENKE